MENEAIRCVFWKERNSRKKKREKERKNEREGEKKRRNPNRKSANGTRDFLSDIFNKW